MVKLLEGDPVARGLLAPNGDPFEGGPPPTFIRAAHFEYAFSPPGSTEALAGDWWTRRWIGEYAPPLQKGNPSVESFLVGSGLREMARDE